MSAGPQYQPLPAGLMTLADHEALAATRLDAGAWAYLCGGAGDEITLQRNRSAWDAQHLLPRVLRTLAGGHTRLNLLGRTLPHPILLAPVAYQKLFHPDGELATAHAAAAQGAGLVLSTQASTRLETVAEAYLADAEPGPDNPAETGRGPLWFQLYPQPDHGLTRELVRRAEAAGYEALVLTVDAPCHGARDRERRAGFRLPPQVSAVNLAGFAPPPPAPALQAGQSALFDHLLHSAPTWADIARLQAETRLPLLLKGVLHPDDAREARRMGVAGLIVSNHGGRTLDTALPTAAALPRIVEAVEDALPVLVDGGIRRGTDILKALALGAQAVLVGRPYACGLANAGAMGVAHVIRLLRDELEIAMALCGCRDLAAIGPEVLAARHT